MALVDKGNAAAVYSNVVRDEDIGLPDLEELEIELEGAPVEASEPEPTAIDNYVEVLDERVLRAISQELVDGIENDIASLRDWRRMMKDGLQLLGLSAEHAEPLYEGEPIVTHPMLLESIVKYQAKGRSQILPAKGPALVTIPGESTPLQREVAKRQTKNLNYKIRHEIKEYGAEHDRMLFAQAFFGSGITKTYYDPDLGRCCSRNINLNNIIIDSAAPTFDLAERKTEVLFRSTAAMSKLIDAGLYSENFNLNKSGFANSELTEIQERMAEIEGRDTKSLVSDQHVLYECHARLNVAELTDIEVPVELQGYRWFVATIHQDSGNLISLYLNEDEQGNEACPYVHWPFIPGFGIFGYGYLHLIGGLAETSSRTLRQLLMSGSFSNFPAGFKSHGLRVVGSSEPLVPGEWREVNAIGADLSKSLVPLPYREPSAALVKLLELTIGAGQRFADSVEEIVNNAKNYGPVNTTLALMEASGQLFNGIHERLFEAQQQELELIYNLDREFGAAEYPFVVPQGVSKQQDLQVLVDVLPVTDPKMPSAAHKLSRAQSHLSVAMQAPDQHDLPEVFNFIHEALGEESPRRFLRKPPPEAQPLDPISENSLILTGQPVRAAPEQNHDAHIKVLMFGILKNPLYSQNSQVLQLAEAHLQEHLALKFKVEMEQAIGGKIPTNAPPELQEQIAVAAAEAISAVVQKNTVEAMELVRDTVEVDPALKLREQELAIKDAERQDKHVRDMAKLQLELQMHEDDIDIDEKEIESEEKIAKRNNITELTKVRMGRKE